MQFASAHGIISSALVYQYILIFINSGSAVY